MQKKKRLGELEMYKKNMIQDNHSFSHIKYVDDQIKLMKNKKLLVLICCIRLVKLYRFISDLKFIEWFL